MVRSIVVACIALVLCGCSPQHASNNDGKAMVVRVIDGDTIVVHISGRDENVRILGIDTPETHKPDTPVECFGPEASERMSKLLPPGTIVRLVRDVEARDRYGRLLAYVYRESDGLFVDETMVAEGYAGTLAIPPNLAHRAELDVAASQAQVAGRGLWQTCGGNHVPGPG
jgi:micrococcal nuclease